MIAADPTAWWVWPTVLFLVTTALGIVTVVGGLGGGTIFVPLVSGFFPFHLDFVRAAGLMVALSGALSAGPELLKKNLADLRLALPVALVTSASAIVGARVGLALPTRPLQVALGGIVIAIMLVMLFSRRADFPWVSTPDRLSCALGIAGVYHEASLGRLVEWRVHRTWAGLGLFVLIGLMAGMFGIGAGWANVPVLNLVMGAPLKVAAGTSVFLLATTDTAAAWVYLHEGAVLPMIVVPSVMGMMIGARIGVGILAVARPRSIRVIVVSVLLFAGVRLLLKGLGVWN
ncbi:MAG: sulfite exporter TauE/SafE family protein [Candidatus Rokubacteria bacterium]|nr:sulfite exporter TauE/SafE family protein [Candidatus Rokubacteria bacterium]